MKRRSFITGTLAVAGLSGSGCTGHARAAGRVVGASHEVGHQLRVEGQGLGFGAIPAKSGKCDVLIVGAGMAGLMAAWRLQQAGVEKVTILDLEPEPGGNARSGQNGISAFPWGAHYVPEPGPSMEGGEVVQLLEELGVIIGRDLSGRMMYDDRYVCSDPVERLYVNGVWQDGLVPQMGATKEEKAELQRFHERMEQLKHALGRDGKRVFAIPLDNSSRDSEWRTLDAMTMAQWLEAEGFTGERVRWLVDYGCCDDYGADASRVSAWAGLHYFASRETDEVLTWAEGNGFLVRKLMEGMKGKGVSFQRALVRRMKEEGGKVLVDALDPDSGESWRWGAKAAVCALPRFVAQRVVEGLPKVEGLVYSPWVVANLNWKGVPPPAWDNVIYGGKSLGYVVATHQALNQPFPQQSVLTWYQTRHQLEPVLARQEMLARPWEFWRDEVLNDLRPAHPDIEDRVTELNVMLWGHGMVRPVPGWLSSEARAQMLQPLGRIAFAHTDMSGISIFEEACERGALAARKVVEILEG